MTRFRFLFLTSALLAVSANSAWAQRRVTGHVVGPAGEPIGSAQVRVQGTTISAITAGDGSFAVTVSDGPHALLARRLGYRVTTVPVAAGATDVTIKMDKDVLQLDKMVVTGVATTVSSQNAANAVAVVTGSDLTKAPAQTIESDLQGKIPGAVISTNSGAPGGGSQVQLRGVTSINASSSPLYVVDGVLVSNDAFGSGLNSITNAGGGISSSQDQQVNRIADLDPNDIESIEVLKGASAGAIYGSKASNGVIVITTKHGQAGAPKVSFTQRYGQYTLSHQLHFRCFTSASEANDWWNNVYGGAGAPPVAWQPVCHDFEKEFYGGNPASYETDLAVSGGTAATSYYIGGLASRDNAIQKNSYYQKQSITANIGQLIGDRINLRANNQFIHSLTDRGISGNDNSPVSSPGDIFSATPTWVNLGAKVNGVYPSNPFVSDGANPWQDAQLIKNPEDVYRYIGSVNTNFSAYNSSRQTLDFTLIAGVDAFQYNSHLFSPPSVYFESADGLPGTIVTNKTSSTYANLNLSGAHKLITNRFTATTSFGLRQERRQSDAIYNRGQNIPAGVTDVQYGVQQSLAESQFLVKDFAYYAQEEFLTLHDRLFLTAAINAERSSVNGDDKKFYTYPKYAASYRLPWLPRWTDDIKLRVAYGKAGNQPGYGSKFTSLPTGVYGGQLGATPSSTAGNPAIKPETSTETEGGLDAEFLGGRAAFTATIFNKRVDDLILSAAVAPSTGYTTKILNGGSMRNTGTEYSLSMTPIEGRNFTWVSRTTFANVWSRVTHLDVPCFLAGSFFSQRFGAPYVCTGYSVSTIQAFNGWDSTFSGGTFVSRTRHISNWDSAPKYTMGFSNDFTWKNFSLSSLFDYRRGGYAVDLTGLYVDPVQILEDTTMSNARFGNYLKGYAAYVEPAGFVKLRELSLTYTLPRSLVSSLIGGGDHTLRLQVSGRNLATWTKYKGYDPEVSNFSSQNIGRFQDVTPYPPSRSVFFSVIANF
ncbi:MAG TPA: SusC/RagA family TonB-linked outer membrane protein [Gemmatimonadaceae bacterium]|nr:SusC/RagA family TonB-linked outer membrane protein [Gemmatimonadaceae bacterium]